MSKFTIYDRSGNVLHESITEYSGDGKVVYTDSLEYNGSWMGECFITVSVKSPYPINFQIGDYIDYRGERFTLNNDPSVSKKARRGTYGEAFVFENIKFEARQSELTEIRFLDYVLYDNELHYTSLPDFPFYAADIDDYVDRQQANTNRWCESNGFAVADYWLFITPSKARTVQRAATFGMGSATASAIWEDAFAEGTYLDDEKKDISVDISKESIWDSMQRIKQNFGLNFISRGRRVIIGAAGVPTSRIFKYGKGEGLYEIERQIENDQAVVTKLFAYGSDKNMPVRYYGNISYSYYATVGLIYANYASSGLHYAEFLIDIDFKSTLFTNRSQSYPGTSDNPYYIVEVQVDDITVRGYVTKDYNSDKCRIYCEHTNGDDDRDEPDENKMDAFSEAISTGDKVYFVAGIDTKKWPADKRENTASDLPNNMAVSRLMLPGFPTTSLYAWILANGGNAVEDARNCDSYGRATWEYDDVEYDAFFSKDQYNPYILSLNFKDIGIREASKVFDGSDDTEEIYPTIEGTGYDVIAGAEVIEDNGVFEDGDTEPTITLTLPDFGIGFDLKKLASDGQNPTIFMKDGYCGSREFTFESGNVKKNQDGTYTIKAKREHDTLLDLWFPYSYGVSCGGQAVADEPYQVRAGDHYVLTGIEMTSTYINASAVKLLGCSLQFLAKNDYTRYTYLPKVDEIEMARQHERAVASQGSERSLYLTLKEGDVMLFKDTDLGIDGDVFIDSLQIKENGNNGIPTFEVTLRNDKQVGTIQKIQNKIDSLSSAVGGGVGISNQGLKNAINAYGSEMFIRKDREDIAHATIGFLQGLWVKAKGLSGIDADGNGKFNNMDAGGDVSVGGNVGVNGQSTFNGNIKNGMFVSGNQGWQITPAGMAEFEGVRVRSVLEVYELLINRLQAQEGDTLFTDNDQIVAVQEVVSNNETSYILTLKEKWDGYITSQKYGNIVKGIINTLAAKEAGVSDYEGQTVEVDGSNSYYTSWMQVVGTNATDNTLDVNQIRVVLYGDDYTDPVTGEEVHITPQGKNFAPCDLMTIARWGCYQDPEEQGITEAEKQSRIRRQRMFAISVSDGRVVKYSNVNSPLLRKDNYGVTIGELPDFVKDYTSVAQVLSQVGEHSDWLYAQGIVVGNLIKVDIDGHPQIQHIDKGEWQNNTTYLCNEFNSQTGQYETHDVWHNGCKWRCKQHQPVVSGGTTTYYEPKWNSQYWDMVEGNSNYSIEFSSSKGYSFRRGYVDTVITPHLFFGNTDISADVNAQYWNWTRSSESGKTTADEYWDAQHTGALTGVKTLTLTNQDMPQTWSSADKAIFTCTVSVSDGRNTIIVENYIIS